MTRLPPSIPRARDHGRFRQDPLRFLEDARRELGELVVLRDAGPVFSRSEDCAGVVAAFGERRQREALTDLETFAMPPSAAIRLGLDDRLANLNRSLHGLRGERHATQRRIVGAALDGERHDEEELRGVLEDAVADWRSGEPFGLLSEMRHLTRRLASHILFGECSAESAELAGLLELYFHLRREAASPAAAQERPSEDLIEAGSTLDAVLRSRARGSSSGGVLGRLRDSGLTEDEVVGHANILFVSSYEPVAVALTWTLLILSQLPELRAALRDDDGASPSLLDSVISESMRILPPNAIMVRITSRATTLGGVELPERSEVVLCPFVSHRDPATFPLPDEFRPARWRAARPTAFEYLPFGAGGHACVGRRLATQLLTSTLAFLVERHDLVLAADQSLDWRLHVMLMPAGDPNVIVRPPGAAGAGGRLRGPVEKLLRLGPA